MATPQKHFAPEFKTGKPTNWNWNATVEEKLADGWVYVSIPERNPIFQKAPYPAVTINQMKFVRGRTYLLPASVAATVNDRMSVFQLEQIRTVQPDLDARAVNDLEANRSNGTKEFSFDAEQFAVA